MAKESQPNSFQQLQAGKERLERVIGQREQLIDNLQGMAGKPGLQNKQDDIYLGGLSLRANASIERASGSLSNVNLLISERVGKAQKYLDDMEIANAQIGKIRELVDLGALRKEVLELRETELAEFSQKANEDAEIKSGLELLQDRKEQLEKLTEETQVFPAPAVQDVKPETKTPKAKSKKKEDPAAKETGRAQILVDPEKFELTIDGRTVKFRPNSLAWQMMLKALKTPNRAIKNSVFDKIARRTGSKSKYPVAGAASHIRGQVEIDPKNPKIFTSSHHGRNSTYKLNAEVEFVGDEKTEAGEKKSTGLPQLINTRVQAIEEYISNSNLTVQEIKNILGPSEKTHKELTWPQAKWALERTAHLLYAKIKNKQASESEVGLWEKIKEYTESESDIDTLNRFKDGVGAWFRETKKTPTTKLETEQIEYYEEHDLEPLSDGEMAILALAIHGLSNRLKEAGLRPLDPKIKEALYTRAKKEFDTIRSDDLQQKRKDIFEKAEHLIESDVIYELFDLETDEKLELYKYLTSSDQKQLLEFIKAALTGANLEELIDRFNYEKNGNEHVKKPVERPIKRLKNGTELPRPQEKEQYTIEDLASATGISIKLLGPRVSVYLKTDSLIKPYRIKGKGRTYFFSPEDYAILLKNEEITKPVKENRLKETHPEVPTPLTTEVKETKLKPEKKSASFGLELARTLISHFAANKLGEITEDSRELFESIDPKTNGPRLTQEEQKNKLIKLFVEDLEKYWKMEITADSPAIERQILKDIDSIKKRVTIETFVRTVCRHFDAKIPDVYHKKPADLSKPREIKKIRKVKPVREDKRSKEELKNLSAMERKDRDVRSRISTIFDDIRSKGVTKPISGIAANRLWQSLKDTTRAYATEHNYISPERGRTSLPIFGAEEIAIMLYTLRFDNNFTPRDIKDLKRIVKEEAAKSEKIMTEEAEKRKREKNNGKK